MTETSVDETLDAYEGEPVESETEASFVNDSPEGEPEMTDSIVNQTEAPTVEGSAPPAPEPTFEEIVSAKLADLQSDIDNAAERGISLKEKLFAGMMSMSLQMMMQQSAEIDAESKKIERPTISTAEFRKLREASDDPEVKTWVEEMKVLEERLSELRNKANSKVRPDDHEMSDEDREAIKKSIKDLKSAHKSQIEMLIENTAVNDGYGAEFLTWYKENSPHIRQYTRSAPVEGSSSGQGRPKEWQILRVNGRDVERITNIINNLDAKKNEHLGRVKVTNAQLREWRDEFGQHFTVPNSRQTVTMVKVGEENDGSWT